MITTLDSKMCKTFFLNMFKGLFKWKKFWNKKYANFCDQTYNK